MVCRVMARTAAYRRTDNWVSSRGRQNTGSAHRPTTATASAITAPVAQTAEPMPSSPRSSSRSSGPKGQRVREWARAAARTASHRAVRTRRATSSSA